MSKKKSIVIKMLEQPICEKCGKPIYQNQQILFLYMKMYHAICGYNN